MLKAHLGILNAIPNRSLVKLFEGVGSSFIQARFVSFNQILSSESCMCYLIIKCVCTVTSRFMKLQIELESSLNKWVIEWYDLFMVLGVMHINEIIERFTQITKAQMHFLR